MKSTKDKIKHSTATDSKPPVMGCVSFLFPQIVMEKREVELTKDEIMNLENMCLDEKTDWIWSKMTEKERSWSNGKEWLKGAIDMGYAGFRF